MRDILILTFIGILLTACGGKKEDPMIAKAYLECSIKLRGALQAEVSSDKGLNSPIVFAEETRKNYGKGDEFYFSWPSGSISGATRQEPDATTKSMLPSASCMGSLSKREFSNITVNGKDLITKPLGFDERFASKEAILKAVQLVKSLVKEFNPSKKRFEEVTVQKQKIETYLSIIPADFPDQKLTEVRTIFEKKLQSYNQIAAEVEKGKQKKALAEQAELQVAVREVYASTYERGLLDKGMDAYVQARGKDKTTLHIKYVLCSRPLIHQLSNDSEYVNMLRTMGFKKFECSDGYYGSYWFTF